MSRLKADTVMPVMAEMYFAGGNGKHGKIVIFNDRGNRKPELHFNSDYQIDNNSGLSVYIDPTRPSQQVSTEEFTLAVYNSGIEWQSVNCSGIQFLLSEEKDFQSGYMAYLLGYGGSPVYVADINHAGFLPGEFFELLEPNGSNMILAVTFTFAFHDGNGNMTDRNGDDYFDVAFREIYYNDDQPWNVPEGYDIESTVLHETGHALSLGHFGAAYINRKNNQIRYSPRAVMNASYSGIQRELNGSDRGAHCGLWSQY